MSVGCLVVTMANSHMPYGYTIVLLKHSNTDTFQFLIYYAHVYFSISNVQSSI